MNFFSCSCVAARCQASAYCRRSCDTNTLSICICECSCNEDAGATGFLDSLLSSLGEELGLDDDGDLGEGALAEYLEKALDEAMNVIIIYSFGDIDNSGLVLGGLSLGSSCFGHEGPELVEVDGGTELLVSLQTEVTHSPLTEVSGMATSSNTGLAYPKMKYRAPPHQCLILARGRILRRKVLTICSC
jgi:hypothetical protein